MKKSLFITLLVVSSLAISGGVVAIALGVAKKSESEQYTYSTEKCHEYFEDNDFFHDQAAEYISNYSPSKDDDVNIRLKVRRGKAKEVKIAYTFDYNKNNPAYHEAPMRFEKVDNGHLYDYWLGVIPHNDAPYQYHFEIKNDVDSVYYNLEGINDGEVVSSSSDWTIVPDFKTPSWSQGALWYSIMPESFYNYNTLNDKTGAEVDTPWNGHNSWAGEWFGGDLEGIKYKEDYLYNTLNITSLFLNPLWVTEHNAGYGSYDFYQIDSSLGNNTDLLNLVQSLHKDDLKVMLDAVFEYCNVNNILNNISLRYPDLINDTYYNFLQRDANGDPVESVWSGALIDFSKLITREYLYTTEQSVMLAYIIYFGIDAWRMDVGNTLTGSDPNNWGTSTQILKDIRKYLKEVSEDILYLTEHADANQLTDGIMDSKWNYNFNKGLLDWCQNNSNARSLSTALKNAMFYLPRPVTNSLYNFLTTHDTEYFYELIKYDKTSYITAEMLLLTYIGSPCIYFGEEYGQVPNYYTDSKIMSNSFYTAMNWDQEEYDNEIFTYVKQLTELRKEYKNVFTVGGFMNLYNEIKNNEHDIYAYARFNQDSVIVVLNRHKEFVNSFELDVSRLGYANETKLYDYMTGREYTVNDGKVTLDIASYGSILTSKPNKNYVSDLLLEKKNDNTNILKADANTYLLSGNDNLTSSNFAYVEGVNNYSLSVTNKDINGSVAALIKDKNNEGNYYGVKLFNNSLEIVQSINGLENNLGNVQINQNDAITILRSNDNLCCVSLNGKILNESSAYVPFSSNILLGVANLSGENKIGISYKKEDRQIGTYFEHGLSSLINEKESENIKCQNNALLLKNDSISMNCRTTDFTFKGSITFPTLEVDKYSGIYIGQGTFDSVFLGKMNSKIVFGQMLYGALSIYGEVDSNNNGYDLQIEKVGTSYFGVILTSGGRTVVGKINVNYSSLIAGAISSSSLETKIDCLGFGDLSTSITDYSYQGKIDFDPETYIKSVLNFKYEIKQGNGFAYDAGYIKETSNEEDSVYSYSYPLKNYSAIFTLQMDEPKEDSSYIGFVFDANDEYENGCSVKIDRNGRLRLFDSSSVLVKEASIPNFALNKEFKIVLKCNNNHIYLYTDNNVLLISEDSRTISEGYFAFISHNCSYSLSNYSFSQSQGSYITYEGEMYSMDKNGNVNLEMASNSSVNYFGLRDIGFNNINIGFNVQLDRISPIKRGYFDINIGSTVGEYYLNPLVIRFDDLGRLSIYENGVKKVDSISTNISNMSSAYLNINYQKDKLSIKGVNYLESTYFDIISYDCLEKHNGTLSFYSGNAGVKLNHIQGYAISDDEDFTQLSSYTDIFMEEPVPPNMDPVYEPMTSNYHNSFDSNSSLSTLDRYSGQCYIDEGKMVVNGSTTVNWDAGAAVASGTLKNFRCEVRMKVSNIAVSGGFAGIEFYKSATSVNHQGSALTLLLYSGGYVGLFCGNGMLTNYNYICVTDVDGYITLQFSVVDGTIKFGDSTGYTTVKIADLPNNSHLSSGFLSLNAGAAIGTFDYINIELL